MRRRIARSAMTACERPIPCGGHARACDRCDGGCAWASSRCASRSRVCRAAPGGSRRSAAAAGRRACVTPPWWSTATASCCGPTRRADGRWRLPVGASSDVDPRFLDMLLAYEDRRFRHASRRRPARARRARPGNWSRHGDIVSGARPSPCRWRGCSSRAASARFTAKLRQMVRAVELERALQQGRDPRALSDARALWRQSRRRARGLARLFRQGAEAADAARRRRCWWRCRNRRKRAGPIARRDARATRARPRARPHRRRWRHSRGRDRRAPRPSRCRTARKPMPMLAPHAADQAVAAAPRDAAASPDHRCAAAARARRAGARARRALGADISVAILAVDHASGEMLARVASPDYFDMTPRRAGRHDAGAALAGLDAQAVHLRARLSRTASSIPRR